MADAQIVLGITLIFLAIIGATMLSGRLWNMQNGLAHNIIEDRKLVGDQGARGVELENAQFIVSYMSMTRNDTLTQIGIICGTALIIFIIGITTTMQGLFNRRLSQESKESQKV